MIGHRFMALLCCPCGGALSERDNALRCTACDGHYPIVRGIPRFSAAADPGQAKVAEAFGYKWTRAANFAMSGETQADVDAWILELFGWHDDPEFARFLNPFKTILDAGAGNGRDLVKLARLCPNALIVGIDVSEAIDAAAEHLSGVPNVFLVQGDLMRPPFKPAAFDYISSNGVLHHTPSTEHAVKSLYCLLAPGGELAFTIYRKKAPIREFTDDYVRRQIRGMTPEAAWKEMESITLLGKILSDLRAEVEIPEIKLLGIEGGRHKLQRLLYYTMLKCYWRDNWSFEDNVLVNYDWYYPEYAWRHTPEEVRHWVAELSVKETFFKQVPAQLSFRFQRLRAAPTKQLSQFCAQQHHIAVNTDKFSGIDPRCRRA
jgi:SAM-dependent methyltransferase